MINAGIIGATGYAGQELIRLLFNHEQVNIKYLSSHTYHGKKISEIYPNFYGLLDNELVDMDADQMAMSCDIIFFALPHGLTSKQISENILNTTRVIDLGADFRLKDQAIYEKWYKVKHEAPEYIKEAEYGLCELNRGKIRNARIVANPGCYTTCSITSLAPLLDKNIIEPDTIIIDAKSGISGAGRNLSLATHFTESNETFKAYAVGSHRHTPEIEQELSRISGRTIILSFTPHLLPMNRGILTTSYASLKENIDISEIRNIFTQYYKNEKFIRICPEGVLPETRYVKNSNFIDIGFAIDSRTGRIVVVAAIDNLIKGASGQAVQNMNIMFGLNEDEGLRAIPGTL